MNNRDVRAKAILVVYQNGFDNGFLLGSLTMAVIAVLAIFVAGGIYG